MLRRAAVHCDRHRQASVRNRAWQQHMQRPQRGEEEARRSFERYLMDAYHESFEGVDTRRGMSLYACLRADVERQGRGRVSAKAYSIAVSLLAQYGQDHAVRRFIDDVERHAGGGAAVDLYVELMHACLRRADYDGVDAAWEECRRRGGYADVAPGRKQRMLVMLLKARAVRKDLAGAAALVKSFASLERIAPTRVTLELLVRCCETPAEALRHVQALKEFGYDVEASTVAALVSTARSVEEAEVYWRLLRARGAAPTLDVYREAISLARRVGDPEKILVLMREMGALGLDVKQGMIHAFLMCVAEGMAGWGAARQEQLLQTAVAMVHTAQQHTDIRGPGLFVSLLKCYASAGMPEEAEKLRALIVRDHMRTEQVKITNEVQRAYDVAGIDHEVTPLTKPADMRGGRSWVLRSGGRDVDVYGTAEDGGQHRQTSFDDDFGDYDGVEGDDLDA